VQCGDCGSFVRWAKKPRHIALTSAQRAYLAELGHDTAAMPQTQEEGRRLIAAYLTGQRW